MLTLAFSDNRTLALVCGPHNSHLSLIEDRLDVAIDHRGDTLFIKGGEDPVERAGHVLRDLEARADKGMELGPAEVEAACRMALAPRDDRVSISDAAGQVRTRKRAITPRSPNQRIYLDLLSSHDLVFGLGPAGTGKTYLAVAMAVTMMMEGRVDRIILSRPAVEAGERLGFLPGDLREKVDPYLRPLYDALYDMLPAEQVAKQLESGEIEVAPLAFMRGRTLANAFIILDEAQNTTPVQMKMFLTRLGENSHMAITGDPSQIDLPLGAKSGLIDCLDILGGVEGVGVVRFTDADVVRHALVTRIVRAYMARERGLLDKGA